MRLRPAYSAFTTLLVLAVSISSCSPAPISDPFDDSGELLALSGGDAGPQAACHTCHGLNGEGDGAMVPHASEAGGAMVAVDAPHVIGFRKNSCTI